MSNSTDRGPEARFEIRPHYDGGFIVVDLVESNVISPDPETLEMARWRKSQAEAQTAR